MKKLILHLCADTGTDTKPYQDDPDYEVQLVGSDIGVENFHVTRPVHGIIANPVCTDLSRMRKAGTDVAKGMVLVNECLRVIQEASAGGGLSWWVMENPASSAVWKELGVKPRKYQPWQYGSPWTKHTGLYGVFHMPDPVYEKPTDVPKIDGLYCRWARQSGRSHRDPLPGMIYMHKNHYDLIEEFHCFPKPTNDAEFRSMCSQNFARAFKKCNV